MSGWGVIEVLDNTFGYLLLSLKLKCFHENNTILDKLVTMSLVIIVVLFSMHILASEYLKTTAPTSLEPKVETLPVIFPAFGAGLFLVKGYVSHRLVLRMRSKAATVERYYKLKIITNIFMQTTIFFSDLTAAYALAMFSFFFAYGHFTPQQVQVYGWVELYALVLVPSMSLVSILLERRFSRRA